MKTTTVDELQLWTGVDIPLEGIGVTLKQPTIKEISMLGESNYFVALQLFTMTKDHLRISVPDVKNWDIFQQAISQKVNGVKDTRVLITNFLQLFFSDKINIGPRSLIIAQGNEIKNIENEDFDILQNLIGQVGGKFLFNDNSSKDTFKPINQRAAQIAAKMQKARSRLAQVKAAELAAVGNKKKGFLSRYIKIISTKTANSLADVNNMTIFQLDAVMRSYLAWEAYDLDIKSRLAGAKSDKELEHWSMAGEQDSNIGVIN